MRKIRDPAPSPGTMGVLAQCVVAFVIAGAVAWGVFEAVPHLENEHANLFQAQVFAQGRVTNPEPEVPEAFYVPFVVTQGGQQFGKYPPGFPLLLAFGVLVDQPWLVNATASALIIFAMFLLGRDALDGHTGILACTIGLASPMFVLLSGTLLSHTSAMAALTLFAWAFFRARRPDEPRRLGADDSPVDDIRRWPTVCGPGAD